VTTVSHVPQSHIPSTVRSTRPSKGAKRWVAIVVAVLVLAGLVLGTKVVSNDSPVTQGRAKYDPKADAAEKFPQVREWILEHAVDGKQLAQAIAANPTEAASKYGQTGAGTPVYSVKLTGKVAKGTSGIYNLDVAGIPSGITVRVQTGPAIIGTDLRDATGTIPFSDFANQIDYQDAASGLNDVLKQDVLASIEPKDLAAGQTVTVTGAFTAVNAKAWLVTPVKVEAA
jgi:predicted lipoprotein